jgi:hypothetical protein
VNSEHPLSVQLEYSVPSGHEGRRCIIVALEDFAPSNKESLKSENSPDWEEMHLSCVLWGTKNLLIPSKQARGL